MGMLEPIKAGRARRRASCSLTVVVSCSTMVSSCLILLGLSTSHKASACVLNLAAAAQAARPRRQMPGPRRR